MNPLLPTSKQSGDFLIEPSCVTECPIFVKQLIGAFLLSYHVLPAFEVKSLLNLAISEQLLFTFLSAFFWLHFLGSFSFAMWQLCFVAFFIFLESYL